MFSIYYDGFLRAKRPLPAGEYMTHFNIARHHWRPCGYQYPEEFRYRRPLDITVVATSGTLHEAFFDPVKLSNGGLGADGDNGVLKPTTFSVDGTTTDIERIELHAGSVEVELDLSADLANHHADFIALDGSVALRLDFDDATESSGTLSWTVCDRPWNDGDLLMLRISHSPSDLSDTVNDAPCPDVYTPTPIPTLKSAATLTPTS